VHLAVFGGSFDPPHNGHLALCLFARELLALDRLIISPSNNPFKRKSVTGDLHRQRMVELLASEINLIGSCCDVSDWELQKQQPSYTIDLIRHVHSLYPHDKLTLLVGEDSFAEFPSWKEYESLFTLCDIVVFRRASFEPHVAVAGGTVPTRFIPFNAPVSSTEIRVLAASGASISRMVPASIARYIAEQALYREPPFTSTPALTRQES